MTDDNENQTPDSDPSLGHQKALVAPLVAHLVIVADWLMTMFVQIPIPDKIELAITGLLTGLAVWLIPHGK